MLTIGGGVQSKGRTLDLFPIGPDLDVAHEPTHEVGRAEKGDGGVDIG